MLSYVNTSRGRSVADSPVSGVQVGPQYSEAQLHARACIVCDRVDGALFANGHVAVEVRPGENLVWAVVACPEHQGSPS